MPDSRFRINRRTRTNNFINLALETGVHSFMRASMSVMAGAMKNALAGSEGPLSRVFITGINITEATRKCHPCGATGLYNTKAVYFCT